LFVGGGFSDYALHLASEATGIPVEVVFACDSWAKAVEVHNANLSSRAVVADVKDLTLADLPEHDLVIGGPPCQSHSTAGPRDCHCNVGGPVSPRCCLADFVRLSVGSAYVMENVRSRLIRQSWSEQFCALDFGDVTLRKRWFYSDHLLHVLHTPSARRFRDIRDPDADRRAAEKGGRNACLENTTTYADDDALGSLTAHAWHGFDMRHGKLVQVRNGGARHAVTGDEVLGSITADSWHGTNMGGPSMVATDEGVRCPSLLEMARAHSVPDTWDFAGATKTDRGLLIANGWPVRMGTAVLSAALRALACSITPVVGGCFWLSENGIYYFDGSAPAYDSERVTDSPGVIALCDEVERLRTKLERVGIVPKNIVEIMDKALNDE
jgi:site-specific DNA-cytosine methylase